MKILFLSYKFFPSTGGIETISKMFTLSFHEQGHEILVLTTSAKNGSDTDFPFTIIRNPDLAQLLRAYKWADIVFENNPTVRLGWPRLFMRKPSLLVFHTWLYEEKKISLTARLKLWYAKSADKKIAVSKALLNHLPFKAELLHNFFDNNIFQRFNNIFKEDDFVFLGRLVPDKGADIAIKALAIFYKDMAKKNEYEPILSIVGDGIEREKLEELVLNLNLKDKVLFQGQLNGSVLSRFLNKHKYIVVPSFWEEPFGLVVLEGMACGCIPIVSESDGLREAVGDAGLTFQKGNADALAVCMKKITKDKDLENMLRIAGSKHILKFNNSSIIKTYMDMMKSMLNNPESSNK